MTQRNIDVMDIIVSKIKEGTKLSKALKLVYNKRNVFVPYVEDNMAIDIRDLGMTGRSTNALLRNGIRTITDIIDFCTEQKITKVKNLGVSSGIEVFETILDYCWDHMNNDERTKFLIDTVERNSEYIRKEIA